MCFPCWKEGSGKTEMAVHLMFKYSEKNFLVRKVDESSKCMDLYDPCSKMFMLIDDVFDLGTVKDWWQKFTWIRQLLPSTEIAKKDFKAFIVLTSRTQKLDDAENKMLFSHRLQDYIKIIDSEDALTDNEKWEILTKKKKFAKDVFGIEELEELSIEQEDLKYICDSSLPFGFPLCARLFACDKTYRKSGKGFFMNPQAHVFSLIKKIIKDDKRRYTEVLFLLLLIHQIRNEPFRWKKSKKNWNLLCELGIENGLNLKKGHVCVKKMEKCVCTYKTYLRESEEHELQFCHPSFQEAMEKYFFQTYTEMAIELLPMANLLQKMNESDSCRDIAELSTPFICRLKQEITNKNVLETLQYQGFKRRHFSQDFVNHVTKDVNELKAILSVKDSEEGLPFIYWFTKNACNEIVLEFLNHDVMEQACPDEELFDQHFFTLLASCSSQEKNDVMQYILKRYPQKNIQSYFKLKENSPITKTNACCLSPILEATKFQNENAVKTLIKHGAKFPFTTWQGWPFLQACCEEHQICCSEFLVAMDRYEEKAKNKNEKEKEGDVLIYEEKEDFYDKIIRTIEASIERANGKLTYLLLDLIDVSELEITDQLIKAFCSLESIADFRGNKPLNFGDNNGNSVLHLLLIKCGVSQENKLDDSYYMNGDVISVIADNTTGNDVELVDIENETVGIDVLEYTETWNERKLLQTLRVLRENNTNFNIQNKMGQTPLMIELSKANPSIRIITCLLSYGANPNEKDNFGRTSIHLLLSSKSAKEEHVNGCIGVLVKHGADVNLRDKSGYVPIFLELRRTNPRIQILSRLLAEDVNIDMNALDANGKTPLDVVMQLSIEENRRIQIMEVILLSKTLRVETGKDSSFTLALSDLQNKSKLFTLIANHESCQYPLHECIEAQVDEDKKIEALERLLSTGSEKFKISPVNDKNETLLITAARVCPEMKKLFDFLLSKKVDINAKDNAGKTALAYLLKPDRDQVEFSARKDALFRLLSEKPNVYEETEVLESNSPLSIVMQCIVYSSYLFKSDCTDVQSAIENQHLMTKPHLKNTKMSIPEENKMFVSPDIIVNILDLVKTNLDSPVDVKGRTYLHYCASSSLGDKQLHSICERLIKLGVNVDQKDHDGFTCIDMALKFCGEKFDTLVFLLENSNLQGLDIDASLERLADKSNLNVKIFDYLKQNIFCRIKPQRNLLHYLASIRFYPKSQKGSDIEDLFNCLQNYFATNEKNSEKLTPLHLAIESNASVSCVLCFLKISLEFINERDCKGNTALHLVLKSDRMDVDVCTIVEKMLENNADVNAQNGMKRTPLMVAVKCAEDRLLTIAKILKHHKRPDLMIQDQSDFTILHHCIEEPKDDFTTCKLLSLFLDCGIPVPWNLKSSVGLTPLNAAARNGRRSRVLCLLKLLQRKECDAETVDEEGQSPLHYTAVKLKGKHPLVTLERLVRSYILFVHGISPELKTNDKDTVFDICRKSNYSDLLKLLRTESSEKEEMYVIIKIAWLDVARQIFSKNEFSFEDILEWSKTTFDEKMKSLIRDSLPFLSHCKFDELKNVKKEEDIENQSSTVELE